MSESRLRVVLEEFIEENNYQDAHVEVTPLTDSGGSFTSELYLVKINTPQQCLNLFAKVCRLSEEIRSSMPTKHVLNAEFYFYKELLKKYNSLEEKHNVPDDQRLVVPKFYKGNTKYLEEVLVLDNLTAMGFTSYKTTITWEYAKSAVEQVAKLHALSLSYQHESPDEFDQVAQSLPYLAIGGEKMRNILYTIPVTNALEIVKAENKERLKKFFETDRYQEWLDCYKPKSRKVLVHGDFKTSNLMQRIHNGKLEVIPVDYQNLHSGCPVSDLMYLVFTGTDEEFRRRHYKDLLEHYYTQLTAALCRLNVDVKQVYSKQDFDADIKAVSMFGLFTAIIILPVSVAAGVMPDMSGGAGINDFKIDINDEFVGRLNGVIDDYVSWGLL